MIERNTYHDSKSQPKIEMPWDTLIFAFDRVTSAHARAEREEAQLRSALRRERLMGRSGHRSYNLTRHMALSRRLRMLVRERLAHGDAPITPNGCGGTASQVVAPA